MIEVRDEDLKNLPQSIEGWQVAEMLKMVGITDYRGVRLVQIEPRKILVEVYASDENGKRYFEGDEAAVHSISIPFVGNWVRPGEQTVRVPLADLLRSVKDKRRPPVAVSWDEALLTSAKCKAVGREIHRQPVQCERSDGHPGLHANADFVWRVDSAGAPQTNIEDA